MKATDKYEPPRIESHETLELPLIGFPVGSGGGLPSSAAFRTVAYEPPRIESSETVQGALVALSSNPVL
jgi:hypothetical protein